MLTKTSNRVCSVLLVGSPFDEALVEHAGFRNSRSLLNEQAPVYCLARTGVQALEYCYRTPPDLVITDFCLPDMTASELKAALAEHKTAIPVMVTTARSDVPGAQEVINEKKYADDDGLHPEFGPFVWYGDPDVLRTLVRLYEDEEAAKILLSARKALVFLYVEDEPSIYSHGLPVLFSHIWEASLNAIPKLSRPSDPWSSLPSRPLVLLRKDFESCAALLEKHAHQLVGIITDMRFPKEGHLVEDAGLQLLRLAHTIEPNLPVVVQSQSVATRALVEETRGLFLWKDSPNLIDDLKGFLRTYCGFGPFVFRTKEGDEWGQANTLSALRALVAGAPLDIMENLHAHNSFSAWLGVHGYEELARKVRGIRKMTEAGRKKMLGILDKALTYPREGGETKRQQTPGD